MKTKIIALSVITAFFAFSCGGKKEEKNEASKPGEMKAQVASKKHMGPPKKVEEPKVEEPKKVEPPKEEPVKIVKNALPVEATIFEMEGTVEVKKANTEVFGPATKDLALNVGDHVRLTGENTIAKLRLWDESTVVLGTGSEVVINPGADLADGSPSITVLSGTTSLAIEPRSEDQSVFRVYTPSAILSVLGTEFDVGIADTGSVKVGVEEGLVEVADQEGVKKVEVPKGKQVEVALDGKATAVAAYNPETEDWSKWYESKTKEAEQKIDALAKTTSDKLEAMKKQMAQLEEGIKKLDSKANEMDTKVNAAVTKNDVATYNKETKPYQDVLEEKQVTTYEEQRLTAMMAANVYLLRRLQAMVKAGIIKPSEARVKLMQASVAPVTKWIDDDYQAKRYNRLLRRHRLNQRWKTRYYRHHPRGRKYVKTHRVAVPAFYKKLPTVKYVRPKRFKPKYVTGIRYTPNHRYRGKARPKRVSPKHSRNWYRNKTVKVDPRKAKKYDRIRKRMKRRAPRRVVIIPDRPRRMRHNRGHVKVGPNGAKVHVPGARIKVGPNGAKVRVPGARIKVGPNGAKVRVPGARVMVGPGKRVPRVRPRLHPMVRPMRRVMRNM
ncbi:MAG: FecR domain-containing protein [Deltaproteobacteria bacterium]|nr:FecR domain-containing protein [Deltaproteobacteria bacterium]